MGESEGKVVVFITLSNDYYEDLEKWVARMKGLGITACRQTEDEAATIAFEMLAEEIQVHRRLGNLELWLKKIGASWDWDADYVAEEGRTYRDLSGLSRPVPLLAKSHQVRDCTLTGDLALAA